MTLRNFNQAPLPFQGQKRTFIKPFKQRLSTFKDVKIIVDLFGGSGLLSHTAKQTHPHARVIYNDFDNYNQRLAHIDKTNLILQDLRAIIGNHPKEKRLTEEMRLQVLKRLRVETGFVDWITLSSAVCFSMNYVHSYEEMENEALYNCIRQSDINGEGYLQGVETVRMDYRELFNLYRNEPGVLFLIDPPYLSTDVGTYENYWKLADYLDVMDTTMDTSFFFFTSSKSNIIEFMEWSERKFH